MYTHTTFNTTIFTSISVVLIFKFSSIIKKLLKYVSTKAAQWISEPHQQAINIRQPTPNFHILISLSQVVQDHKHNRFQSDTGN